MIRVGFSRATGFWSFLSLFIRFVIGRPYSHCWILLEEDDAPGGIAAVLTEDEHGGLHYESWETYGIGKNIVKIVTPGIPLEPGYEATKHLIGKTGYDIPGLFGEGWVLFAREWLHRKLANPFRSAGKMWCSEYVAYVIELSGYPNAKPDDWQRCTPADVDDLLSGKEID